MAVVFDIDMPHKCGACTFLDKIDDKTPVCGISRYLSGISLIVCENEKAVCCPLEELPDDKTEHYRTMKKLQDCKHSLETIHAITSRMIERT